MSGPIALRFVTADEARCLEVKRGMPHFLVEGETYLVDGRPVGRSRDVFRGDVGFRVRSLELHRCSEEVHHEST